MIENNKVEEYINKVCTLIKNKDVHYDINLELKDHIQTLKEEYLDSGMCEEEATEKALSHMGAPDLIGKELDKTHKAKVNLGVIIPLLCFSLFGLVTMYFLQSNGAVAEANYMKIFQKNLLFYIMGIGLMVGLYFFDYRRILPYSKGIYIASVIILIQQLVFNTSINGNYFLNLGFITVNIMPICLTLLVISLSGILQNWNWNNPYEFLKALGIIILPGMFMITRPITYGFLYFIACITLMIMSKAKVYQILISILSPFLSFFIYFLSEPYRLKRFLIFLDPARDPEGSGWLYIQVKKVIESSGAFGNGFTMKSNTIPELHTDFIFTYIVYTFGWVVAAIMVALITVFIVRLINVAKITKNSYGKLLVSGFIAILASEFLLNLGMNFGFSPIIGISLPFIGFGGSQLIINMVIVGLILSVYRRKDIAHNFLTNKVVEK